MKKKSFYLTEAGTRRQILVTRGSFDYATTPTEDEINDLIKNNKFVQPIHLMGWLMVKKGVL